MKLKKSLVCVTILGIVLVGCHKENTKEKNQVANKATQQKTMTKVQNDVNEIMSKDYNFVIKNMGIPYNTIYYIKPKDLKESDTMQDINTSSYMTLVYPKYTGNNELDGSALYIDINKNKVVNVETNSFSSQSNITIDADSSIMIEKSDHEKSAVSIEKFRKIDLGEYIGVEEARINEIVGDVNYDLIAYDHEGSKVVKSYRLKEDNKLLKKEVLTISIEDNKIKSIKTTESDKIVKILKGALIE
ncbi:putative lipoprotein [Clostridioides difficile CD160]|nr:putative lipoprotein [Clostridioides difficile CD160]